MEKVRSLLKSMAEGKSVKEELATLTKEQFDLFQESVKLFKAKVEKAHEEEHEVVKTSDRGQWSLHKNLHVKDPTKVAKPTMTPPKTIDYSQTVNKKPDYASIEANAPTINYKDMNDPKKQPASWKQKSTPETMRAAWSKLNTSRREASDRQRKTGVITKHDGQQWDLNKAQEILEKPPVSEAQRKAMWAAAGGKSNLGIPQSVGKDFADADKGGKLPEKVKKNEGVLLDEEHKNIERMTAKNEIMGYGPSGTPENAMMMAEKEPHKDDPKHEEKEQVKAKKIKEEAQELLDMHKAEKTHSVFTMDHAHAVLSMPHDKAKEHLHAAVDSSSATPANKSKIKSAINGSKSVKDLSHMVSNHVLAAGGKGIGKVGEHKVIR